jgi:XTP/dITP diphosphohydrolase
MIDLLLATNNPGKVRQLRAILPSEVLIATMDELGLTEPVEDGETFAENANTKALAGANASGLLTLADDSGLEVEALGGRPGVRSARFAGENPTDDENIELLLSRLSQTPQDRRRARFVCVLSLAQASGVLATATGTVAGTIGFERRGSNGFGYDPVFLMDDGRTMAEISPDEKNVVSHRSLALREMLPSLLIAIGTYRFANESAGQ